MKFHTIAVTALTAALAGCGGGSSNEKIETRVVQPTQITAGGGATIVSGNGGTKGKGFPVNAYGYGLQSTAEGNATKNVKAFVDQSIITAQAPIAVQYEDDDYKGRFEGSTRKVVVDNSTRLLMSDASAASPNAPSTFGIVKRDAGAGAFKAAAYYGGKEVTNLPTSGTATYAGAYGDVARNGESQINRNGNFALQADFNAGAVEGKVTNLTDTAGAKSGDIAFKAGMDQSRAAYSTANGSDNFVSFGGQNSANAAAEGRFFNDNASETAGVIRDSTVGHESIGAFHGSRQ